MSCPPPFDEVRLVFLTSKTKGPRGEREARGGGASGGVTPPALMNMRKGGLEPPRPHGHTLLRRARLPFRHFRAASDRVGLWHMGYPAANVRAASEGLRGRRTPRRRRGRGARRPHRGLGPHE